MKNFDAMHEHVTFLRARKAFIKRQRHRMFLQRNDVNLQSPARQNIGHPVRRMSHPANLRRKLAGDNAGLDIHEYLRC
jgi:hypothetical protein